MRDLKHIQIVAPVVFSKIDKQRIAIEAVVLIFVAVMGLVTFGVFALMANTPQPELQPVKAVGVTK